MLRLIINWSLKALTILVLQALGWLSLSFSSGAPASGLSWPTFWRALLLAVVFSFVGFGVAIVWAFVSFGTLGLGLVLYPFIGGATLGILAKYAPSLVQTNGFWLTVLSGFIIMVVGLPSSSRRNERRYN